MSFVKSAAEHLNQGRSRPAMSTPLLADGTRLIGDLQGMKVSCDFSNPPSIKDYFLGLKIANLWLVLFVKLVFGMFVLQPLKI